MLLLLSQIYYNQRLNNYDLVWKDEWTNSLIGTRILLLTEPSHNLSDNN